MSISDKQHTRSKMFSLPAFITHSDTFPFTPYAYQMLVQGAHNNQMFQPYPLLFFPLLHTPIFSPTFSSTYISPYGDTSTTSPSPQTKGNAPKPRHHGADTRSNSAYKSKKRAGIKVLAVVRHSAP